MTSADEVSTAASKIREKHGNPTVLINNAGIVTLASILDVPLEKARKVLEVNTFAHFICVKEFLPSMVEKNHGHVITIASLASFITPVGVSRFHWKTIAEGLLMRLCSFRRILVVRRLQWLSVS